MLKRFLLLVLLVSCNSPDFFHEGERKCHQIVILLKEIQSREDLVNIEDLLEKKFQELVDIMIMGHKYVEKHPEGYSFRTNGYSEELLQEFKRIYALEGCRERIENAQKEPMIRLDAYLNKRKKEKKFLTETIKK